MRLIVGIEDRSLWVPAHAGCSHLMNRKTRWIVVCEGLDVACSRRGKHLRRRNRHILADRVLVLAKGTVDLQHGNSPCIHLVFVFVELGIVVVVGQTLTVPAKGEPPRPGAAQRLLELWPKSCLRNSSLPSFTMSSTLKTISSQELDLLCLHVAKSRNVDPVGPSSEDNLVLTTGNKRTRAAALHMIHQIVTKLSARVRQPI